MPDGDVFYQGLLYLRLNLSSLTRGHQDVLWSGWTMWFFVPKVLEKEAELLVNFSVSYKFTTACVTGYRLVPTEFAIGPSKFLARPVRASEICSRL